MIELKLNDQKDLARFCGVSEGLVSQWFQGLTKLGPKPLKAFSRKTSYNLDWLSEGTLPKFRRDGSEAKTKPSPDPAGEMNGDQHLQASNVCHIPVIELSAMENMTLQQCLAQSDKSIVVPKEVGPQSFAIVAPDNAMNAGLRPIPAGVIVVVDPDKIPASQSIVLVKIGNSSPILREWVVDGDLVLLRAADQQMPARPLPNNAVVIGSVYGVFQKF